MSGNQHILGRFLRPISLASVEKPWRLGLLGGTFDPVHFGHLILAQSACEEFALDGVLFIPTAFPFYKSRHTLTDAETRYEMLSLAVISDNRFETSRIEIDRETPCYTIDTLNLLDQACAGKAEFYLIVGADSFKDLPKWKRANEIAQKATVLYGCRPGTDDSQTDQVAHAALFKAYAIGQPRLEISSSALRLRAALGLSARYYTPDTVAAYITKHHLYQSGVDCDRLYKTLHDIVHQRLSTERYTHTVNVVQTASNLASQYGVDIPQARLAALLHDWDKDQPLTELVTAANRFGIEVSVRPEKLLHAQTGAAVLGDLYPELPAEVIQAISRHTTGAINMTDLDMVIYVADMIEPGRSKGDMAALRSQAGRLPLTLLFQNALQSTIQYLDDNQHDVHPDSQAALQSIKARNSCT
ncbi:MAG: nicotinate-nucleotide adenylyltransferase, partial [Coriobacteriales bacterium]|nr:nicotinate-nucleotide adenylyltransferase [Coriobacteriales bacterium]